MKHTSPLPLLKAPVRRGAVADPGGVERAPCEPVPSTKKIPSSTSRSGTRRRPPPKRCAFAGRDQALDPLPHLIRDPEDPRHRAMPRTLRGPVLHVHGRRLILVSIITHAARYDPKPENPSTQGI